MTQFDPRRVFQQRVDFFARYFDRDSAQQLASRLDPFSARPEEQRNVENLMNVQRQALRNTVTGPFRDRRVKGLARNAPLSRASEAAKRIAQRRLTRQRIQQRSAGISPRRSGETVDEADNRIRIEWYLYDQLRGAA